MCRVWPESVSSGYKLPARHSNALHTTALPYIHLSGKIYNIRVNSNVDIGILMMNFQKDTPTLELDGLICLIILLCPGARCSEQPGGDAGDVRGYGQGRERSAQHQGVRGEPAGGQPGQPAQPAAEPGPEEVR